MSTAKARSSLKAYLIEFWWVIILIQNDYADWHLHKVVVDGIAQIANFVLN